MTRFSLACLAIGLLTLAFGSATAEEITHATSSNDGFVRTAELRTTDADVSIEPVRRGRYYGSYGPSYRRYSYYPRSYYRPYGYSYSYRYPSYTYRYPSYSSFSYSYPRYYGSYGYPRYYSGYRGYGYPGYYGGGYGGGGVYIGRGGISIGW